MTKNLLVEVVAGCLIKREDKFLLVQEKKMTAYGLWNLPAGHVDEGESLETGAIREVFEETGFNVTLAGKIYLEHKNAELPILHAFRAYIVDGTLKVPTDELLDVRWFTRTEIEQMEKEGKLRDEWVLNCVSLIK
jgi:NADH pyrophosphatase NudC (nudix superfamily)